MKEKRDIALCGLLASDRDKCINIPNWHDRNFARRLLVSMIQSVACCLPSRKAQTLLENAMRKDGYYVEVLSQRCKVDSVESFELIATTTAYRLTLPY
jgi:hypothetical protein